METVGVVLSSHFAPIKHRIAGRGNQDREVLTKCRNVITCFRYQSSRKDLWGKLKKRQGVSLKHPQWTGK